MEREIIDYRKKIENGEKVEDVVREFLKELEMILMEFLSA